MRPLSSIARPAGRLSLAAMDAAPRASPQHVVAPGELLRVWRIREGLSQLELSLQTGVSTRHISYVETGRAQPSRRMIVRLAAHLDIPLHERNRMLLAAGHAPAYPQTPLDQPSLWAVREAIGRVLGAH